MKTASKQVECSGVGRYTQKYIIYKEDESVIFLKKSDSFVFGCETAIIGNWVREMLLLLEEFNLS